jgi:hypothetical protein
LAQLVAHGVGQRFCRNCAVDGEAREMECRVKFREGQGSSPGEERERRCPEVASLQPPRVGCNGWERRLVVRGGAPAMLLRNARPEGVAHLAQA